MHRTRRRQFAPPASSPATTRMPRHDLSRMGVRTTGALGSTAEFGLRHGAVSAETGDRHTALCRSAPGTTDRFQDIHRAGRGRRINSGTDQLRDIHRADTRRRDGLHVHRWSASSRPEHPGRVRGCPRPARPAPPRPVPGRGKRCGCRCASPAPSRRSRRSRAPPPPAPSAARPCAPLSRATGRRRRALATRS